MHVLIKGKVYSSSEIPIMILFGSDEASRFKSEPEGVDIHCSFPDSWDNSRGQSWMHQNKDKVSRARDATHRKSVMTTPTIRPPISKTEKMTDESILKFINEANDKDIEVFEDTKESSSGAKE